MCVVYDCTFLSVKEGCAERDYHINEENKVDKGINESNIFALYYAETIIAIENGHRNCNRIVHGKNNDHVVPFRNELRLVTKEQFAI